MGACFMASYTTPDDTIGPTATRITIHWASRSSAKARWIDLCHLRQIFISGMIIPFCSQKKPNSMCCRFDIPKYEVMVFGVLYQRLIEFGSQSNGHFAHFWPVICRRIFTHFLFSQ